MKQGFWLSETADTKSGYSSLVGVKNLKLSTPFDAVSESSKRKLEELSTLNQESFQSFSLKAVTVRPKKREKIVRKE
jgi:hypothetical protein